MSAACLHNKILEILENKMSDDSELRGTCFYSLEMPEISLRDYMTRLTEHLNLSVATLTAAVMYLDRYAAKHPFGGHSVHRLWGTSCSLAMKYLEDETEDTRRGLCEVLGLHASELAFMEYAYMREILFDLNLKNFSPFDNLLRQTP